MCLTQINVDDDDDDCVICYFIVRLVRKIAGPHICGDSLDIDPVNNHILTGSWRKDNPLQASNSR